MVYITGSAAVPYLHYAFLCFQEPEITVTEEPELSSATAVPTSEDPEQTAHTEEPDLTASGGAAAGGKPADPVPPLKVTMAKCYVHAVPAVPQAQQLFLNLIVPFYHCRNR